MTFQEADHILIPLLDGTHAQAQVVRVNQDRLLIHLTATRATQQTKVSPIPAKRVLATVRVDKTSLSTDQWPVIGYESRPHGITTSPQDLTDGDALDPAIVEAFANALNGLYPWDGFPDPDFFTQFLRRPAQLPDGVRMSTDFPTPDP